MYLSYLLLWQCYILDCWSWQVVEGMDVIRAVAAVPTDRGLSTMEKKELWWRYQLLCVPSLVKDRDERPRVTCTIVGCGEAGQICIPVQRSVAIAMTWCSKTTWEAVRCRYQLNFRKHFKVTICYSYNALLLTEIHFCLKRNSFCILRCFQFSAKQVGSKTQSGVEFHTEFLAGTIYHGEVPLINILCLLLYWETLALGFKWISTRVWCFLVMDESLINHWILWKVKFESW